MSKRSLTGINIQFPISQLIVEGEKTIETRTYPIPEHYLGKELAIVETPGKSGHFKARVIGSVVFGQCFQYRSERDFYADEKRHRVSPDSPWKWAEDKPKWGWEIHKVTKLKKPVPAPKRRGIVYTKDIEI